MKYKYAPYSYSRINTYLQCPRKFEFQYVKGIKTTPADILVKGSMVHEILEKYLKHLISSKKTSDSFYIIETLEKEFFAKYPQFKEYLVEVFDKMHSLVIDYSSILSVEEEYIFDENWQPLTDWWDDKAFFRMRIDFKKILDDFVNLVDWKTGFKLDYDKFQAEIYALAEHIKSGARVVYFNAYFFNPINNFEIEPIEIVDFDNIKERIKQIVTTIENDTKFKPQPQNDTVCSYCEYARQCMETEIEKGMLEIPERFIIDSPEKARDLIYLRERAKAFEKAVDNTIKEYVARYGGIPMENGEYKYVESNRKKVENENGLTLKIQELGLEPDDYKQFSMTKLNKLLKTNADDIDNFIKYTKSQSLKFVKYKKENKKSIKE